MYLFTYICIHMRFYALTIEIFQLKRENMEARL